MKNGKQTGTLHVVLDTNVLVSALHFPESALSAVWRFLDDPKDNHILACALARKVDMVVSGDKDLLRLKEYEGIPIVRPMDFLRTIGEK